MKHFLALLLIPAIALGAGRFRETYTLASGTGTAWFTTGEPVAVVRPLTAQSGSATYKDAVYLTGTVTSVTDYRWQITSPFDRKEQQTISGTSNSASIARSDSGDLWACAFTSASNATATISYVAPCRTVSRTVSVSGSSRAVTTWHHFTTNTVAENARAAIDTRIAGKVAGNSPLFTTRTIATQTFIRSGSCWASDINLTGVTAANSYTREYSGFGYNATAITPLHVIMATHHTPPIGTVFYFVTGSNTTVARTLTATKPAYGDINVGKLDSALPASIQPVALFSGTTAKLPIPASIDAATAHPWPVPLLWLDQEKKAHVADASYTSGGTFISSRPSDATRQTFWENCVAGDSGNPVFFVISGTAVMVAPAFCGAPGGQDMTTHYSDITTAITALGGSGTPSTINLSSFATP